LVADDPGAAGVSQASSAEIESSRVPDLEVTVVHERFTELGGSEAVTAALSNLWSGTRVVAPLVNPSVLPSRLPAERVTSGSLNRLYGAAGDYRRLLPLLPHAMRSLDLGTPDIVIASHHSFANRACEGLDVPTLSYTHSPGRWIWGSPKESGEAAGIVTNAVLSAVAGRARRADHRSAQAVDRIVVNSNAVRHRVEQWWDRHSEVVAPPVDTDYFTLDADVEREDFLLLAGRLVPYKRPDFAIAAAEQLGQRLVVIGEGRVRRRLQARSSGLIEFRGRVSNHTLRDLYRRCRALVFPGEEDFGIIPVEAIACGAPVVALRAGGVLDSLAGLEDDGVVLYDADHEPISSLMRAIRSLRDTKTNPEALRARAEQYSPEVFNTKMRSVVLDLLGRAG
jgi:glycosyltransferase involved in cell wall biosynthesis